MDLLRMTPICDHGGRILWHATRTMTRQQSQTPLCAVPVT
jgi:hypothetical protein